MTTALTELLDTKEEVEIKDLIHEFRGKHVMLDSDIADLFEVETKRLNEQMKRNVTRFPKDFCFQLTSKETTMLLRSQNATSNLVSSKRRYNPFVYTEHGIIALAGVLRSDIADQMCALFLVKFNGLKSQNAISNDLNRVRIKLPKWQILN